MATLPNGRESAAGVDEHTAFLIMQQGVDAIARISLGNGLPPESVALYLRSLADAIDGTTDVAEDTSPIVIHLC